MTLHVWRLRCTLASPEIALHTLFVQLSYFLVRFNLWDECGHDLTGLNDSINQFRSAQDLPQRHVLITRNEVLT